MKKIKTNLEGLFIIKSKIFYDNRGFLREAFKKKIIKKNLIFAIVSKSKKNVLRGLHLQKKNQQDKCILVLKGKIIDVAVDMRKKSKTYGKHYKIILSDKNGKSLLPAGINNVNGKFEKGDHIKIIGIDNKEHARGLSSFSSNEIYKIKGCQSKHIKKILGYSSRDEVVHKDDMVEI